MPRLLKNGMVQLHMPRTGGRSLAQDIGVKDVKGSIHDGYNFIPDEWKDKPIIATWRDRQSWEKSVIKYMVEKMNKERPLLSLPSGYIDNLTLGFWGSTEHNIDLKKYYSSNINSMYDLWSYYFLIHADFIIPITKLKNHIK